MTSVNAPHNKLRGDIQSPQTTEVATANQLAFYTSRRNYTYAEAAGRVHDSPDKHANEGFTDWIDCRFNLPSTGQQVEAPVRLVKTTDTVANDAGILVESVAYSFESEGMGPAAARVVWATLTETQRGAVYDRPSAYRTVTSPFGPDNRGADEDVTTYFDPVLKMVGQLNAQVNIAFLHL